MFSGCGKYRQNIARDISSTVAIENAFTRRTTQGFLSEIHLRVRFIFL